MTKVRLHPLFEQFRGTINGMVFRLPHSGTISAYMGPDMSQVKWSSAQVEQRARLAEASAYGVAATRDPELHAYYMQMSIERKGTRRPYDMAVSDYTHGINLLGDKFRWDRELWEVTLQSSKRKRR